jgi:hypothetical protein
MRGWLTPAALIIILSMSLPGCAGGEANRTMPAPRDQFGVQEPKVVIMLQPVSSLASVKQSFAITVTLDNHGTHDVALPNPCGDAFDLIIEKNGQEVDDWIHQFYGGPPACPPNRNDTVKVGPGASYSRMLNIRFSAPGTFSVYAVTRDHAWRSANVLVDAR